MKITTVSVNAMEDGLAPRSRRAKQRQRRRNKIKHKMLADSGVVYNCLHDKCKHNKCKYRCVYNKCRSRVERRLKWNLRSMRHRQIEPPNVCEQMANPMVYDYVNLVSPVSAVKNESIIDPDDTLADLISITDSTLDELESSLRLPKGEDALVQVQSTPDSENESERKAEWKPVKPSIEHIQTNPNFSMKLKPDDIYLEVKPKLESSSQQEYPNPFITHCSGEPIASNPAEPPIDITDISVLELVSEQSRNSSGVIIIGDELENCIDLTAADNSVILIEDEDCCSPANKKAKTDNKKKNQKPLQISNQISNQISKTTSSVASTSNYDGSGTCYTIGAIRKKGLRVIVIDGSNVAFG